MTLILVVAWCVIGLLSVPWLTGELKRHDDGMVRDPAMEALIGLAFGPVPLATFVAYLVFRTLGRIAYQITGQNDENAT